VAEFKLVLAIPELEGLMADLTNLQESFESYRDETRARFDRIDNVLEQVRAGDQAAVDAIQAEVDAARTADDQINVEDPSGDDPAPPAPAP